MVNEDDALRYGEYLTDDEFVLRDTKERHLCVKRIRTIKYEGHVYYHKMLNGDVVEFKRLLQTEHSVYNKSYHGLK